MDVVEDLRPFLGTLGLLGRAYKMPVGVLLPVGGGDPPFPRCYGFAGASVVESRGGERAKPGRALTCGNSTLSPGQARMRCQPEQNSERGQPAPTQITPAMGKHRHTPCNPKYPTPDAVFVSWKPEKANRKAGPECPKPQTQSIIGMDYSSDLISLGGDILA